MADIRINALATTAASTASDDFIAVDGSANGTRKLDAYSPTFGGNLTVNGTTASIGGAASSWDLNAIQVLRGAIYGAGNETGYYNNANYSGGWKYTASAAASGYLQNGGIHQWYTAGSGTAGNAISFTQQMSLNNSGALSLAGNLTVSGNTANFGGADSSPIVNFKAADTGSVTLNFGGTTNPDKGRIIYSDNSDVFAFYTADTERMRLTSSGNVLIGTTTDGGQKLQVNGTIRSGSGSGETLSAGSIDVGADIGIASTQGIVQGGARIVTFTSGNATFAGTILASSATGFVLNLSDTRSQAAGNGASIGLRGTYTGSSQTNFAAVLGLKVNSTDGNYAGKMVLQTRPNGGALTDALTLDDSQNATFAGRVRIGSSTIGASANPWFTAVAANGDFGLGFQGSANGAIRTGIKYTTATNLGGLDFMVGGDNNNDASVTALSLSAAGNATFAGSIAIGNTVQTAAAVASTHKVTISIGGTTYYLLATNV